MKKCAKVFSMVLTFTLVLSVFAGAGSIQAKPAVKVSSIKITNTKKKFRIQKGKTVILNTSVKVSPNKSKYKKSYISFLQTQYCFHQRQRTDESKKGRNSKNHRYFCF